jgi:hypothetical protein
MWEGGVNHLTEWVGDGATEQRLYPRYPGL